jgi:methionine-rich copper-binding protein CopC
MARLLIATLAAALLLGIAAVPVAAHGRYKSSLPKKGEVLSTAPRSVEIVFSQQLQKVAGTYGIDVTDAAGASLTADDALLDEADRSRMAVALEPGRGPGRYVVRWHNVSDDDSDPAEGAFAFYVGTEPTPADLDADRELARVGSDPLSGAAPPRSEEVTPTPVATVAAVETPVLQDDDGADNGLLIGGIAIAAVIVAVVGAVIVLARRRA